MVQTSYTCCPLSLPAWLSASHPALVSAPWATYRLCSPFTLFPPPQASAHTSFPLPHTYHSPPPLTCNRASLSCASLPTIFLELHFPQFCVYRTYTYLHMQVHNYVLHVGYTHVGPCARCMIGVYRYSRCLHSPCSKYMDECTCWLPLNPVSHVVIILTLCFTAHTTLSPSSLYRNNLTDGCTEALCTLIMSVKSLTDLWSVTPQLYSTPAVCVLWGSMHVAQCSAY